LIKNITPVDYRQEPRKSIRNELSVWMNPDSTYISLALVEQGGEVNQYHSNVGVVFGTMVSHWFPAYRHVIVQPYRRDLTLAFDFVYRDLNTHPKYRDGKAAGLVPGHIEVYNNLDHALVVLGMRYSSGEFGRL
jgi:hypothetical protein